MEDDGFNPGILDAEIPVAQHVERIDDEDEQVAQKGALFASALRNIYITQLGNADVAIKAQRAKLAVDEAAKAAII